MILLQIHDNYFRILACDDIRLKNIKTLLVINMPIHFSDITIFNLVSVSAEIQSLNIKILLIIAKLY